MQSSSTLDIKRNFTSGKSSTSNSQDETSIHKSDNSSKIKIDDFTFIKVLGKGSFGKVNRKNEFKKSNDFILYYSK